MGTPEFESLYERDRDPSGIPEDLKPKGIVNVEFTDKEAWINAIRKIDSEPLGYEWIPTGVTKKLKISKNHGISVLIKPPGPALNPFSGQVAIQSLIVGFLFTDSQGNTNPGRSDFGNPAEEQRVNALIDLMKTLGSSLPWKKISEDGGKNTGYLYQGFFESPSGNIVVISEGPSAFVAEFKKISYGNNGLSLIEDMETLISYACDLSVQILVKNPKKIFKLAFIPPQLIEKRGLQKLSFLGSDGMVSEFKMEDHRVEVSSLTLSDLGGNKEVKKEIEGLIEQFANPDHFRKYGATLPKGIILYGPPGTGKTLAGKIIASSLGIPFYEFSSADLVSVWVGESPKIVRAIFEKAKVPSVVFLDELDAIARRREEFSGGVGKEIMQELLRNLDGISSRSGLMLMAATNSIHMVDPALLRSGRFDKKILLPLPEQEAREEILQIHFRKALGEAEEGIKIFDDSVNLDSIKSFAQNTANFSGADLAEVLRRVVFESARKALTNPSTLAIKGDILEIIQQVKKEKEYQEKRGSMSFADMARTKTP